MSARPWNAHKWSDSLFGCLCYLDKRQRRERAQNECKPKERKRERSVKCGCYLCQSQCKCICSAYFFFLRIFNCVHCKAETSENATEWKCYSNSYRSSQWMFVSSLLPAYLVNNCCTKVTSCKSFHWTQCIRGKRFSSHFISLQDRTNVLTKILCDWM